MLRALLAAAIIALAGAGQAHSQTQSIPLPEHPRPDFERPDWVNLNGTWDFRFDSTDVGESAGWSAPGADFDERILVPFPWGSPLSGVTDNADIGWYSRLITVPDAWTGQRIFLVVGAADWHTRAWLNGTFVGEHTGGYTPFSIELTAHARTGTALRLTLRVDDTPHPFKLEGKQGYGPARGIWQTPYLEARGESYLESLHVRPDIETGSAGIEATLAEPAPADLAVRVEISRETGSQWVVGTVPRGQRQINLSVSIPDARLWTLDDPYLYDVSATVSGAGPQDRVSTYFGMRSISVEPLPGLGHAYVALNGDPVYLQASLDQAYHPEGYYSFPSDEFVRDEILRAKEIGLNAQRIHVKVGLPRKLYWADRLGMLIMADVPNSWGEPDEAMRGEVEHALREMIRRDFNHPSIFAWVPFNETWGLFSTETQDGRDRRVYSEATQDWVAQIVRLARTLDPTRLVEDNSPCCGRGHTDTDLNSWHDYLPGWAWGERLDSVSAKTYPGSAWNFESRFRQGGQPNINSEFGNVWGYEGSTGDVDWSWDYHRAMNEFRRHPVVAGWLYTEHHDVVNEWNGYWRFDRSEKYTGMEYLVPGMTLQDLHSPYYISTGGEISRSVQVGERVQVPLFASFMTPAEGPDLVLRSAFRFVDGLGRESNREVERRAIPHRPWLNEALEPMTLTMPDTPGVGVLQLWLESADGAVLHRNFATFIAEGPPPESWTTATGALARQVSVPAASFSEAEWSVKRWDVLDGLKVNGAGAGHFTYSFPWPADLDVERVASVTFLAELSAKELFGKDVEGAVAISGDFMRGRGTFDPSLNPNAYPMTDEDRFPTLVRITANGHLAGSALLPDDPADHRGILSWHSQLRDRKLREAGSYGYLERIRLPRAAVEQAARSGTLEIRLDVSSALAGGLAVYGGRFGRFPLDPTLVFVLRED